MTFRPVPPPPGYTYTTKKYSHPLLYDPTTGVFMRRGRVAGCRDTYGHRQIRVCRVKMLGHRLAWWCVHGVMPKMLDHINGDPSDNRMVNLRIADRVLNGQNAKVSKANTSGVKGVSPLPGGRWRAELRVRGAFMLREYFDTIQEAVVARLAAEEKFHPYRRIAA